MFYPATLGKEKLVSGQVSKLRTLPTFYGGDEGINPNLQFYCSWNFLTCHKVYLLLLSVRFVLFKVLKM